MTSTQNASAVSGAELAARLNLKKYSLTVPTIQDARARSMSGPAVANLVGQPGRDWMSDVKRQHWSQIEEMVALFYDHFPPGDLGKDTLHDIFMRFESPKKVGHVLKSTLPEVLKVVFESAARQMWLVVEELSAQYGPLKFGNDKEMAVAKAQHFMKMGSLLQSTAFQAKNDKFMTTVRSDLTTHVSFIDFNNAYRFVFAAPTMPPAPDPSWSPQDWNQRSEPTIPNASSALGATSPVASGPPTTPDEINRAKFDYYRRGALQGNPQAQYLLAMMYGGHDGHGYSSDRQGSIVRTDSTANGLLLSPNSAFTRTGSLSARKPPGARDSTKLPPGEPLAFQMKFQWLVMSAEAGYSPAQYELATLFRDEVVPDELLQKEQLRVQAAEEKLRQEQGTPAVPASSNDSTLSLDNEELAFKDALLINRQPNSDPLKLFARGQMYRWWDAAAKQGEKRSAFQLGLLFVYGVCPTPDEIQARAQSTLDEVIRWVPPDLRKALEWFEKAVGRDESTLRALQRLANQGDAVAQYQLGVHKLLGTAFTPSNKPEAYELFKKSAAQGNIDAKYNLGLLSYIGIYNLLPENPSAAKRLWKEAADQGHTLAATTLANATKYESFDDVVTSTSAIALSDANLTAPKATPVGPPTGEKSAPNPLANKVPPPLGRTNSLEKRIADSMNQKPRENCRGCQSGNCVIS